MHRAPIEETQWRGVAADERWAMEVLGLRASMEVDRDDVNRRFRRLLRAAHPDSGGSSAGAAARIAELTEARAILLSVSSEGIAAGS
jgi:curved DNA-binding protein CbpA